MNELARAELARAGEQAALECYRRSGYRLVARNWRCRLGEIDLVLARGGGLVLCEVKTRRPSRLGSGWEAVNGRKQRKLRMLAEAFLSSSGIRAPAVRFDVAVVTVGEDERLFVDVIEQAF